ncbi:VOC family protein [Natronorarus salvus]|uniref:VOC family protein n=1 Tax=Natronorarus salvus TaxID=3117733 RepID=UPI002F262F26
MLSDTTGLHHVTAIAGDAQRNVEFAVGTLGLRLVRTTVNQEDVLVHHLYYGSGEPGTVLTYFPYPHQDPGRVGKPQPSAVSFSVPEGSIGYWGDRLRERGIEVAGPTERFGERVLRFTDPDGTPIELCGSEGESPVDPWSDGPVPEGHAIRELHGVTLLPTDPYGTGSVLETLGFSLEGQEGDRIRYLAPGDRARVVDLLDRGSEYGREGPGTIHHLAVRVDQVDDLYEWHDLFREREIHVSRVRDRGYFHSLYVREPGGILIELATDGPGPAPEETRPDTYLDLPGWAEEDREMIEGQLPSLELPTW